MKISLTVISRPWLISSSWQSIFNSGASGKLKNVMLVEIHRVVDAESCPPSDEVLARSSTPIAVQRLSEAAVGTYLSEIFKWSPDELHATYLVAFLYEQTLGTPFFLRTLVSSLVRSGTVYFDYARLKWVFDMLDLQGVSFNLPSSPSSTSRALTDRLCLLSAQTMRRSVSTTTSPGRCMCFLQTSRVSLE